MSREPTSSDAGDAKRALSPGEQRILDVATREFARKGFAGARVDAITTRAGVNKNLLYYYFKNKEGLYKAVLTAVVAASVTASKKMQDALVTEDLGGWSIRSATRSERKRWQLWRRLWAWEALERGHTNIIQEEERREVWARTTELLRDAQERGSIDPRFDSEMLLLALEGMVNYPHVLPQVTMLITGQHPLDDEFIQRQSDFMEQLFELLRPVDVTPGDETAGGNASRSPSATP